MGVVNYYEKERTGEEDDKGTRTYTRKYVVQMASTADSPPTCWQAIGILRYDPFPTDSGALAVSVAGNSVGDQLGLFYEVTYKYTSQPFDEGNSQEDPSKSEQDKGSDRPWTVKFGSVHKSRLLGPKDVADVAVVNSAKQPFNPPPEVPTSNLLMTFEGYRDASSFDPIAKAQLYQDAVNDADWSPFPTGPLSDWTFPKWTVKVNEYSSDLQYENGSWTYKVSIVCEVAFRIPWNPVKVLDAGTLQKPHGDPANPPEPILDKQGQPIQAPVPLMNGIPLAWNAAALNYLEFKGFFDVPFTNLFT